MSLIGSTFFGFAQNTVHDFQNTVLNSLWHCLRQMQQKWNRALAKQYCHSFHKDVFYPLSYKSRPLSFANVLSLAQFEISLFRT